MIPISLEFLCGYCEAIERFLQGFRRSSVGRRGGFSVITKISENRTGADCEAGKERYL